MGIEAAFHSVRKTLNVLGAALTVGGTWISETPNNTTKRRSVESSWGTTGDTQGIRETSITKKADR